MGLFDVKTLSLVALITSLLLPLVLSISAQFTSTHTPATRSWIQGALAYAIGFLLLALRGNVPDWLAFFVGNILIVGGFAELAVGTQIFLRGKAHRTWMMVLTLGNAMAMYWCVVVRPDPSQRVFISSVFLLPICIVLVVEFLAAAKRLGEFDGRGATAERRLLQGMAAVFMLSALSFAWRANAFWNARGEIDLSTLGGRSWGLSFLVGVLLNIVMAICMPLLISRRNQQELSQSQSLLHETERLAEVGSFLYEPRNQHMVPNRLMAQWLQRSDTSPQRLDTFLETLDEAQRTELAASVSAIAQGTLVQWNGECRMRTPEGQGQRWLSVHAGGASDASGRRYVIVSARNITEFKLATESAIEARNEADRANAAKSAFLANMSHEIRTPMNGVLGLTRLCLDGNLPPRERGLIEKCHAAAQTLLGVVNDILDFSKIEAGKLVVESAPFDLERTVNNARSLFESTAGGKGLSFSVTRAPDVPRFLIGDALRLSQILNNLLSNAVKFTDRGEIQLNIHCQSSEGTRVALVFAVQDTGIGMNSQQMQGLFQAFSQADVSTTRRFGGTGLGLAISQRLAGLMGGTLSVSSVAGVGTTFTACLPFQISRNMTPTLPVAPAQAGRRLQGLRVLLVEDNPTNVLVATLSLEAQGALVTHCADGQQAVDYLRQDASGTDVVLMDIQMPVMDGHTATHQIRQTLGLTSLPIVAMTANVLDADRRASKESGMNAHVGKPFDVDELVGVVLQVTGAGPRELASRHHGHQASNGEPNLATDEPLVALQAALQRMGNDALLLRQAADSFMQGLPGMFATLRTAPQSATACLHTLKGLAATLGLQQAAQQARNMEAIAKRGETLEAAQIDNFELEVRHALQVLLTQLPIAPDLDASHSSPALTAPPPHAVHAALSQLADLLTHADLAALECFARHRPALEAYFGNTLAPLDAALQRLDLEAANAECTRLMDAK